MSEPLKPCPFCGGKARLHEFEYDETPLAAIDCASCGGGTLEYFDDRGSGASGRERAIAAWNRRPVPAGEAVPTEPGLREAARRFALESHDGKQDKQGEPYIRHVGRVAASVAPDETAEIVGWLHDTVEDCHASLDYLTLRFGDTIAEAVNAITKRKGEAYEAYIERVAKNDIARKVKIADLQDNLRRAPEIPEPERSRLTARYREALFRLGCECSQCGQPWTASACGPTHAVIAAERAASPTPQGESA